VVVRRREYIPQYLLPALRQSVPECDRRENGHIRSGRQLLSCNESLPFLAYAGLRRVTHAKAIHSEEAEVTGPDSLSLGRS
jgi:hypothetical protein